MPCQYPTPPGEKCGLGNSRAMCGRYTAVAQEKCARCAINVNSNGKLLLLLISYVIRGGFAAMPFLQLLIVLAFLASGSEVFAQAMTQAIAPATENGRSTSNRAISATASETRYGTRRRLAPKSICTLSPPKNYPEIANVEYLCHDIEDRINAQAIIDSKVTQMFIQRGKAKAAERERKAAARERKQAAQRQRQSELERQQAQAARLADKAARQQQQALAASAAVQEKLSMDITQKMIAVCEKTWVQGKHRSYCEKYIEHAPAHIQSNPDCGE